MRTGHRRAAYHTTGSLRGEEKGREETYRGREGLVVWELGLGLRKKR